MSPPIPTVRVKVEPVGRERFRESKGNHTMAVADRAKALEAALAQIEKVHGKGSVMRLGEDTRLPIDVVPTGSVALDVALGIGGLPRGRIVEIYGPESSGKTTVALHAIANAQAEGGICAFIDAEHALDPDYANKLGVNTDELLVSQPDNGEQALEIADTLVRSGALALIVIDSVAALTPRAEIEGEMGDSHVGLQARLMSQALRKMTGALKQAEFDIIYGEGISREGSLIDMGVANGIIRKAGAWFTYESDQLGQGKENARNFLKNNPKIAEEIDRRIRAALGVVEQDAPEGKINPETGEVEVAS